MINENKKLLTAIILTHNEEIHLERCLDNLFKSDLVEVIILDSFSSDNTLNIAERFGVKVYQNKWINYSRQFNFALDNIEISTEWILRIDADEYLDDKLIKNIDKFLEHLESNVSGVTLKLKRRFLGSDIKYGNYEIRQLRLFKYKFGRIEDKNMDENIVLSKGLIYKSNYFICDDNLKGLDFFVMKHIGYAKREALDAISKFDSINSALFKKYDGQANLKYRMYFKYLYIRFPLYVRPFIYFFYRYFLCLGFLDGKNGFLWHFMQGLWYRLLVDYNISILQKSKAKSN